MSKAEIVEIATQDKKEEQESTKIKFTKTYLFEGESIGEIDMGGLENMTANDMIKANKVLNTSGNFSVLQEMTLEDALVIASSATGRPIEFFKGLCPRDAIKVKNSVGSFFFGEE